MMWGWGYGAWWIGLMMIIFWAAAIALIVWIVRTVGHSTGRASPGRALEVLEERYARGEIDDEEFVRRRAKLLSG